MEDGEIPDESDAEAGKDLKKESTREGINGNGTIDQSDRKPSNSLQRVWTRRDSTERTSKMVNSTKQMHSFLDNS